ncbi:MAG: hypothetical protein CM1200mP40_19590 [Gammaproteobacteria bacterium]|nr:MAG: hypothetical protein CM1200mP40_19590 [Gammaproteobacteria bacterium]
MISAEEHPKKTVAVNGKTMSYVEMGEGEPIIFSRMAIQHLLIYGAISCPI